MTVLGRLASLALILELALAIRVISADVVQVYVDRRAAQAKDPAIRPICVFPDTRFYWELGRCIREGTPYEIMYYGDIPHFALRTPGYPIFLAGCHALFGERALAVRMVQAVFGTLSVWLVYKLTAEIVHRPAPEIMKATGWTTPLIAALFAAFEPYTVLLSPLILSEALFVPLMLASLWGMACIWNGAKGYSTPRSIAVATGVGTCLAAAVLVRPSWSLFVPPLVGGWILSMVPMAKSLKGLVVGEMSRRLGLSLAITLSFFLVLSPWWIRNYGIYGRLVPTALWTGASLYDGLNPNATGGSDMTFMDDPEIWPLGEEAQDAELTRRALAFVRNHPGQTAWLAISKLGRYWRPWPDAEGLRSMPLIALSSAVTIPLYVLMIVGAWSTRRDPRAWILLTGPVLYFCVLHMAFASSMRYRIPGEVPAFGLAAVGLNQMARKVGWLDA